MRRLSTCLLTALVAIAVPTASRADDSAAKIKVLIIDGQNNHNWQQTTPVMKKILEGSGRFTVDVATSPPRVAIPKPKDLTPEQEKVFKELVSKAEAGYKIEMARFRPTLSDYHVVVSNYNGDPWGDALNADLDSLLRSGKIGYVVVHAANNAFPGWKEYNQMIGMGWRDAKFGKRLKVDDAGKEVIVDAGQDQGSGHRYTGPFTVTVRDVEHPITKGMPKEWMHVRDELYDNMRGPVENVHVLATALSDKAKGGTGAHEPMIWTVTFGKGRVFHTPMGHDANAMRCHGFAATMTRGTEWAATGKVTLALPKEFPTAEKLSPIPEK